MLTNKGALDIADAIRTAKSPKVFINYINSLLISDYHKIKLVMMLLRKYLTFLMEF